MVEIHVIDVLRGINAVLNIWNVKVLCISGFFSGLVFGFLYWSLPIITEKIAGIEFVGIFYSLNYVVSLVFPTLGGTLSDVLGRRKIIIASTLMDLIGLSFLYLGCVASNGLLFGIGFLIYEGASLIGSSALYAILAESTDEENMAKGYSAAYMFNILGCGIGSIILGLVFSVSVLNSLIICSIIITCAFISRLFLKETLKNKKTIKTYCKEIVNSFKSLQYLRLVGLFIMLLTILIAIETSIDGPYYSIYMSDIGKFSTFEISVVFALIPISQAMIQPFVGTITDKKGSLASILIGNLIGGLGVLVFILSPDKMLSATSLIIASMIGSFHNIGYRTLIAKATEESHRGLIFGSLESLTALSSLPFPFIGAILWKLSTKFPFIVSIILSLIISVITLIVAKKEKSKLMKE